jgi:nitrite reductase (NADH) small subunit
VITTTLHRVGRLDEVPLGEGRTFVIDDRQVAVFRTRAGRLYGLSAICPHRGGPLADGQVDAQVVICPLHQNIFELETGCSRSGEQPVRTYPVYADGADIVIELPEVNGT